jgi:hypothetical protein
MPHARVVSLRAMGSLRQKLSDTAAPGGSVYTWAARLSWLAGLAAWAILFLLIPHWYFALPVALLGFWLTTATCGASWAVVRGALFWNPEPGDDRRHLWLHRMAAIILLPATIVGLAGLFYIPNWQDFEYNGHPSLVAVAGSVGLGLLAFILGFGLTAWTLHRAAAGFLGVGRH